MKKVFLFFSMAMLVGVIGAQAEVLVSVDFSAGQGYSDGPLVGQPGSGAKWVDMGAATAPADSFNIVGGKLAMIGTGTGGKWVTLAFPLTKTPITLTFEGEYVGDGTRSNAGVLVSDSGNFNLDSNPLPTYNEMGAMIMFADESLIQARNGDGKGGSTLARANDMLYNDSVKFFIRAIIDPATNKFTVYAKKQGAATETLICENFGFRRNVSTANGGLDTLVIFDNNSDKSIAGVGFHFDNIKLETAGAASSAQNWTLY